MATSLILPASKAFITAIDIKKAILLWIAFQGISIPPAYTAFNAKRARA
jgi:hypothetical protein